MKKVRRILGGRMTKQPEPPQCGLMKDISIMNDTLFDVKQRSKYFQEHYEAEKEAHKLSDKKVTQLSSEVAEITEEKRSSEVQHFLNFIVGKVCLKIEVDQEYSYAAEKRSLVNAQVHLSNELQSVKTDRDEKTCQLQEVSDRANRLSDEKDKERQRVEAELSAARDETQEVVKQLEGAKVETEELRANIETRAFEQTASESLQRAEFEGLEKTYKEGIRMIRRDHNLERFVMNEEFELDMARMKAGYERLTGRIEDKAKEDRQRLFDRIKEERTKFRGVMNKMGLLRQARRIDEIINKAREGQHDVVQRQRNELQSRIEQLEAENTNMIKESRKKEQHLVLEFLEKQQNFEKEAKLREAQIEQQAREMEERLLKEAQEKERKIKMESEEKLRRLMEEARDREDKMRRDAEEREATIREAAAECEAKLIREAEERERLMKVDWEERELRLLRFKKDEAVNSQKAYEKLMKDCKERETLLEERYQKEKAEHKKDAFEWLLKKEQLEEQLEDYRSNLSDLRSDSKIQELNMRNTFDTERASLCGELGSRMHELSKATTELNSARECIRIFKEEIDCQNNDLKTMASRLKDNTSKLDIANDKIIQLHGKIYRMNIGIQQTESDYEVQRKEAGVTVHDYTSRLAVQVQTNQELTAQLATANVQITRLEENDQKKQLEALRKELNMRERLLRRKEVEQTGEQSQMEKRLANVEKQDIDIEKIERNLKEFETKLEEERVRLDAGKEGSENLERRAEEVNTDEKRGHASHEQSDLPERTMLEDTMKNDPQNDDIVENGETKTAGLEPNLDGTKVELSVGLKEGTPDDENKVVNAAAFDGTKVELSVGLKEGIADDGQDKVVNAAAFDGTKDELAVDLKEGHADDDDTVVVNAAAFDGTNDELAVDLKEGLADDEEKVVNAAAFAPLVAEARVPVLQGELKNDEEIDTEEAKLLDMRGQRNENASVSAAPTAVVVVENAQAAEATPLLTSEYETAKINCEQYGDVYCQMDTEPNDEEYEWLQRSIEEDKRKVMNWSYEEFLQVYHPPDTEPTDEQSEWIDQRVEERERVTNRMAGLTEEEDSWLDVSSAESHQNVQNNWVYFTPYHNGGTPVMNGQGYALNSSAPTGHYGINSTSYGYPNVPQPAHPQGFTQPRQVPQQGSNFSTAYPMPPQQPQWHSNPRGGYNSGRYPQSGYNSSGGYNSGGYPHSGYNSGGYSGGYNSRRQPPRGRKWSH